jgi:hypothetical protein
VVPLAFEVVAAPDLFPGHTLSFTEVGFDDVGVRIEYSIAPAITLRVPGIGWVGHARDDLGKQYEDLGSAYGPAGFGERTEGTLTMPFPADEAKALRVRLWPGSDPIDYQERSPAYELLITLEL